MTSRSLAIATLLILSPVETRAQTGSLAGQVLHPNGSLVRDAPIRVLNGPLGVDARTQSRDALEVGDVVTVAGFRAKDRTPRAAVRTVTLSTGERLFGAQDETN